MAINAILLAGGVGSRMAPLPSPTNKCLLPVGGWSSNLDRTIFIMEHELGITRFIIALNPLTSHSVIEEINSIRLKHPRVCIKEVVVKDYQEGDNNVVTLRAVAKYLGNSYIVETDQYLNSSTICSTLPDTSLSVSYLFTQKRGLEDWSVQETDGRLVTSINHSNPRDEYCLSGITYLCSKDSSLLRKKLCSSDSRDSYWEDSLDPSAMEIVNKPTDSYYTEEYDDISDLIEEELMSHEEIAKRISTGGEAVRLSSMTNTTYLVNVGGEEKVLRLPGKGTNDFVDRRREASMDEYVYRQFHGRLNPKSEYYSRYAVKLTDYLSGYHTMKRRSDLKKVVKVLEELHNLDSSLLKDSSIDLMKEISDYENIIAPRKASYYYHDYEKVKEEVASIINSYALDTVVHRDLVPENIMLEGSDVKLIDWEYSGVLNGYWDYASLSCEFFSMVREREGESKGGLEELEEIVQLLHFHEPTIDVHCVYEWIIVVDFVWAVWSLAKYQLGDDVLAYGVYRYERALQILKKLCKEVSA